MTTTTTTTTSHTHTLSLSLDAPIVLGLYWPPLTDALRKYPTIGDTMFKFLQAIPEGS